MFRKVYSSKLETCGIFLKDAKDWNRLREEKYIQVGALTYQTAQVERDYNNTLLS